MRKIYLIFFALLLQTLLLAQVTIPVKLQYDYVIKQETRHGEISYLTFEGAVNLHTYGSFPLYSYDIDLPGEYFECEVIIEELIQDSLSESLSNRLTDNDLIGNKFEYQVSYIGTKARIQVLPFRWNESQSRILQLIEFNLLVDFVPSEGPNNNKTIQNDYSSESVLASGTWVKFGILNTGVHKLTYSDIENMGLVPSQIDINKLGVFGAYSGLLPELNNKLGLDDLQENSIMLSGFDDGTFDNDDYILFYAQAPTTWWYNIFEGRYNHVTNIYSDTSYYFFTPDKGTAKSIANLDGLGNEPTQFVNSFTDYSVHENEYENMISSGKEWYGERFTGDTIERVFSFHFPNLITSKPVYLSIDLIGRASIDSYYDIFINDTKIVDSTKIRFVTSSLGIFARKSSADQTFFVEDGDINVKIKYQSDDDNAIAWLDFIEMNVERQLVFEGNQMKFSNPHASAMGNITEFEISNSTVGDIVWDITDIHNPRKIIGTFENGIYRFVVPTDSLKTFTMFNGDEYYSPVSYEDIQNQNLHAIGNVNFVIIRPDKFAVEAERLAIIHQNYDNLSTICISPQQIYNEFSSGSQDISAIRNFMRMLYTRGAFGSDRAYLLLFGDASFDYKHRIHGNTNLVPTYESKESLRETGSFVTDDYFGLLDDYEGPSSSGELDIGIGRFPISTVEEAITAVDKIEDYVTPNIDIMGDWRTNICFVADDRDNNLHLKQAEGLIDIADTLNKGLGISKIFLDAYNKITVPGGFRYPDVNKKINKQMAEGALILNYTGHGGLIGWSDELVLDVPMINAFDNYNNMPLIITATCEFSRFDDPEFTSAGEYVYLNKKGGAIGLLTTTRLAYAHANYIVNRRIYANLLSSSDGNVPRLGDLVRLSKLPSDENYLNFVLLGDPALTLAYPHYNIITTENKLLNDTIHALSIVNVSGEIRLANGQKNENFNGYVFPKVIDKATKYTTLANDGNSYPQDFTLFDKVLYDGKVSVKNGSFNFEFMVPKDISYNYGYGKIRYYAIDTVELKDAWGAYDQLYIGGIDENAEIDNIGPNIELYLNSNAFKSGDVVTNNPVMLAYISDSNGVNTTGNGLGRDIVMIVDNDYANQIIMNSGFELDVNTYKSGSIVYPFANLNKGVHSITIKAWDLYNNSSENTIEFIVDDDADIRLRQVKNFPNPFIGDTEFSFSHNKQGLHLSAKIRIYNLDGKLIIELDDRENSSTSGTGTIVWDGKNKDGYSINSGVYVYTLEVEDTFGNITIQQQKLIKINK
ncbi:MAG: type IX secretion system sortase PorU [Bacteroidetes bacterium]|nr:type IX secretion system sortase PorU [Bacteroidota bacterium]